MSAGETAAQAPNVTAGGTEPADAPATSDPQPSVSQPGVEERRGRAWVSVDAAATSLHPGFVVIRNALSLEAQLELAAIAFERGNRDGPEGWYVSAEEVARHAKAGSWDKDRRSDDLLPSAAAPEQQPGAAAPRVLNVARKHAGKLYDELRAFKADGTAFEALAVELLAVASRADPHLATVAVAPPTHLLLWNYRQGKKGQRIGWHRDNWQGDGDAEHPVISLSIGASCNFGWRPELPEGRHSDVVGDADTDEGDRNNRSVLLESGDVAIFGGISRMMEHAVKSVHSAASAPPELQNPHELGGGRLNFTFRHAPADGDINVHSRR